MSKHSEYTVSSLDGYDPLMHSLPYHAPTSFKNNNENTPEYISNSFKVSNNKYPECPALMNDGRMFTDYRSSCYINNVLRVNNGIRNSYDYRQFLINNGSDLINTIRSYNIQKSSCNNCLEKPISCKNICNVDRESVNCLLSNPNGFGTCNKTVPLPHSKYANGLSMNYYLSKIKND